MRLSICLIVKNEEAVIGRCLSCAVQFADELIVVDTGSTDRTAEIAREYTDMVYFHPWKYSFAEARNYSYSKATGDYIMWLDADDVISDDNIARLNRLKKDTDESTDVIFTLYEGYSETGITDYILRDRIIRRSLNARWEYDIHEAIPIRQEWNRVFATDITITHKKEKVNEPRRNIAIFDKLLAEKRELTVFEKVNLCKEYSLNGYHDKACKLFLETSPLMSGSENHYALTFVRNSFIHEKRYKECIEEIGKNENTFQRTSLLVYTKALCWEMLKDDHKAEKIYLEAMTIKDDPATLSIIQTGYNDYFPLLRLAGIAERRGDKEIAFEFIGRAGQAYPKDEEWKKLRLRMILAPYDKDKDAEGQAEEKSKDDMEALKKEFDALNRKISNLSDEELSELTRTLSGAPSHG